MIFDADSTPALPLPFVAFVGAGASALPPASLPTWTGFNSLVLEALCERLASFSRDRQPTAHILAALRTRRDGTAFLSPDFQAQLFEEEVGADYFAVWSSLQTSAFSPVHAALAVLAAQGRLAAVVTTNFDALTEAALAAHGVVFSVHHDAASFQALAAGGVPAGVLPVIKIHGSIEDPASLVDTLRQRLAGRPPALQAVLDKLLRRHAWAFLGFSGADFTHAPNYLNVLGSAAAAVGFVFVAHPGVTPGPGVRKLVDAYGPHKAEVVEADLAGWLPATFGIDVASMPVPPPGLDAAGTDARVRAGVQAWVERLGPMAVTNIVVALLHSLGLESAGLWLMRRTWKSYRSPADARGPSYARYNHNHGCGLREVGFLFNRVDLADDRHNLVEWKAGADQNAFEFLARSHGASGHAATGAALASVLAYRGDVGRALALGGRVVDEARAQAQHQGNGLAICDVAIDCAVVYDIVQSYQAPIALMRQAHTLAGQLGDEPRRGRLAALLARFLAYAGQVAEAEALLDEAQAVAERLDLRGVGRVAAAARGLWHAESGRASEALAVLEPLAATLRAEDAEPIYTHVDMGRDGAPATAVRGVNPLRVRVLLDLNRAALMAGHGALMSSTLDELDIVTTDPYRGYCPQYCWAYVQCLAEHGQGDVRQQIFELITGMEQMGAEQGNPWPAAAAAHLRRQLSAAAPGG